MKGMLILTLLLLLSTACSDIDLNDGRVIRSEPVVSYSDPTGIVEFTCYPQRETEKCSTTVGPSLVTPFGTFSTGREYTIVDAQSDPEDLFLILRDRDSQTDSVYRIQNGQGLSVLVDGQDLITASAPREVVVDVTGAKTVQVIDSNGRAQLPSNISSDSTLPSGVSCPGAFPTRLKVNGRAEVIVPQVNMRTNPGLSNPKVEHQVLSQGRVTTILDGPICSNRMLWWKLQTDMLTLSNGQRARMTGWVAEESGGTWLLSPR